jgi:hypothetical protein
MMQAESIGVRSTNVGREGVRADEGGEMPLLAQERPAATPFDGVLDVRVAWYTSAAGVVNGMSPTPVLPIGSPIWGNLPALSRRSTPMPRRTEV